MGRKTSEKRAETRRACGENTPEGHPVCALLRSVPISATGSQRIREETEGHQHTTGSKRSWDLEQDKGGGRKDVNGRAANLG